MARLNVGVMRLAGHRSQHVCAAMAQGIRRTGDRAVSLPANAFKGQVDFDVAVFYGQQDPLREVGRRYVEAGANFLYIDMGYWSRRMRARYDGYHKIVLNGRHPREQMNGRHRPGDRLKAHNVAAKPQHRGPAVLLAGMSGKAAWTYDFKAEQWERDAIARVRQVTDRPILYRPKPSWKDARPLPGTKWADPLKPIGMFLRQSHIVVTHHSNVGVDAIVEGVAVYSEDGAARILAETDLQNLENPHRADQETRQQFLCDLAYCQWTLEEMAAGLPWRQIKDDGLL